MYSLDKGLEKIGFERVNKILVLGDIKVELYKNVIGTRDYILNANNPQKQQEAMNRIKSSSGIVGERLKALSGEVEYNEQILSFSSPSDHERMERYKEIRGRYLIHRTAILDAADNSETQTAITLLGEGEFPKVENEYFAILDEIQNDQRVKCDKLTKEKIATANVAFLVLILSVIIAIITGFVFSS